MPNNPLYISPGSLAPFYPGKTQRVTHSFEDRLFEAEFDDALCDQVPWKNPRYNGSKLIAKKINRFITSGAFEDKHGVWTGDISYQQLPVLTNQTTALYIANTIVGGEENPKYATIKKYN